MNLYSFRTDRHFNAEIVAPDPAKATEIFTVYLVLNDLDSCTFRMRRVKLRDLDEPFRSHLRKILALSIEGIATYDPGGSIVVMPPYDRRMRDDDW